MSTFVDKRWHFEDKKKRKKS